MPLPLWMEFLVWQTNKCETCSAEFKFTFPGNQSPLSHGHGFQMTHTSDGHCLIVQVGSSTCAHSPLHSIYEWCPWQLSAGLPLTQKSITMATRWRTRLSKEKQSAICSFTKSSILSASYANRPFRQYYSNFNIERSIFKIELSHIPSSFSS